MAVASFDGCVASFVRIDGKIMIPTQLASFNRDGTLDGIFKRAHPHMALAYAKGIVVRDLGFDVVWYFGRFGGLGCSWVNGARHAAVHRETGRIYVVTQVS